MSRLHPHPLLRADDLMDICLKDVETIESLIVDDKTINILTRLDPDSRTILHWAALKGNEELVEFLLKQPDVDIEAKDSGLATPIVMAALGNHLSIIKMLVERGANPNGFNCRLHTPLQYCCSRGNVDGVYYLLSNGADTNFCDNLGNSSLHRAASIGRNNIVQLLLEHPTNKPNINLQNFEGNTPLHVACEDQQNDCAITLAVAGASFKVENRKKQKPLDVCSPVLRTLLAKKFHLTDI